MSLVCSLYITRLKPYMRDFYIQILFLHHNSEGYEIISDRTSMGNVNIEEVKFQDYN